MNILSKNKKMKVLLDLRKEQFLLLEQNAINDVKIEGFTIGAKVRRCSDNTIFEISKLTIEQSYICCHGVKCLENRKNGVHVHKIGDPAYLELVL